MTPTDAYRGAGRPEATYAIERAMDRLAQITGIDPVELRRRNFIKKEQFPYTAFTGLVYDSGDHDAALDKALEMVGYDALRTEQQRRRAAGRHHAPRHRRVVLLRDVRPGARRGCWPR